MIEHYWSLCYHLHIQIMSIDNINTKTIFMVLFTSGSLLTWGKPLDASSGISPQVFVYHLLSINCIPFLLQTSHHDIMPSSLKGQTGGGRRWPYCGGASPLPPTKTVPHTLHNSSRAVLPYQPQGFGGETENPPQHHLSVNTSWGGSHRGQEIWSIDHMSKPLSGKGLLHGGSG